MAERNKKKTPVKKLSFGEALAEVEDILSTLESDNVDIDTLGEEVKRAVELIQACRGKLAKTDSEVRELVAGLESDEASAGDSPDEEVPF